MRPSRKPESRGVANPPVRSLSRTVPEVRPQLDRVSTVCPMYYPVRLPVKLGVASKTPRSLTVLLVYSSREMTVGVSEEASTSSFGAPVYRCLRQDASQNNRERGCYANNSNSNSYNTGSRRAFRVLVLPRSSCSCSCSLQQETETSHHDGSVPPESPDFGGRAVVGAGTPPQERRRIHVGARRSGHGLLYL